MSNYYSRNLQLGAEGEDVKAWQEFLVSQGHHTKVTGIFDESTRRDTMRYQGRNGLTSDGIVGKNTYAKAGFKDINTPISAPTIDPAPTAPTFNSTNFNDTDDGKIKKQTMDDALANFNGYGEHNWANKGLYDGILNDYLNREDFSYDLNGDALYQQYKDKYIQQGKMAMQDTMGQASAMTGGYGSSYAQSVGQQAYQNSLDNLNDIVPELYQMAYDRYNQEGTDMLNQLGVLDADYNRSFGEWQAGYNMARDKYSTASSDYYSAADLYNTDRATANDIAQADYTNRFNAWDVDRQEAWNQVNFDEDIRQWQASHNLAEEELELKKNSSVGSSGGSGGGNGGNSGNNTPAPTDDPYKAVDTKNMQEFKAAIKTRREFNSRGGSDKETYKTYEAYIEGILDKWLSQGKLTEDEVASLLVYYGLA